MTKTCKSCKTDKPLECFHKHKRQPDGHYYYCKDCVKSRYKKWYSVNHRSRKAYQKQYREQNSEYVKARKADWYQRNRGQQLENRRVYYQENKERLSEARDQWKLLNKSKVLADVKLRKEKIRRATPGWLTKEHHDLIRAFYEHRDECRMLTGDEYDVDHIVPIKGDNVCGLHVPWNLQILPRWANLAKSNQLGGEAQRIPINE